MVTEPDVIDGEETRCFSVGGGVPMRCGDIVVAKGRMIVKRASPFKMAQCQTLQSAYAQG